MRAAAGIVCAFFAVFALFHLLWAVGIAPGREEIFPGGQTDASLALTIASLVGAAAGAAVIFVTISRVGWHKTRLPARLVHLGAWVVFSWPAIGTLNPGTTWGARAVTCRWRSPRSWSHGRTHGRARAKYCLRACWRFFSVAVGRSVAPCDRVAAPRWPPPSGALPMGR